MYLKDALNIEEIRLQNFSNRHNIFLEYIDSRYRTSKRRCYNVTLFKAVFVLSKFGGCFVNYKRFV